MAIINFQFHTDVEGYKDKLYSLAKKEFNKLKLRYDEIVSASINLDTGEKDKSPYNLKATVVLKTKIKDFVATKIEKNPALSLRESFKAVERQLIKQLDKISRPWEKHKE